MLYLTEYHAAYSITTRRKDGTTHTVYHTGGVYIADGVHFATYAAADAAQRAQDADGRTDATQAQAAQADGETAAAMCV